MTLDQVEMWALGRGIGHAVACTRGYWVYTACRSMANFPQTTERPRRICRKCREAIKTATVAKRRRALIDGLLDDREAELG